MLEKLRKENSIQNSKIEYSNLTKNDLIKNIIEEKEKNKHLENTINKLSDIIIRLCKSREWIPTSVAQPKESGLYLVTYKKSGMRNYLIDIQYYNKEIGFEDLILAWMPLPDQYKSKIY